MHNDFGKDEKFIIIFTLIFGIIYRLFDKYKFISGKTAMLILMISAGYLFFNRQIKLLLDMIMNPNGFYRTICTIQDIEYRKVRRGSYPVYIAHYTDHDNQRHIKEIHSSFSVKKWKIGDQISIRVNRNDPDKIIIDLSDLGLAIIMSIIGIIFEFILFEIYIHIN